MCSLNHTSDTEKRLGYANPNYVNQLKLNLQINKNNEMYKTMNKRKLGNTKRQLTNEKGSVASSYLGQVMLRFQDKECIMTSYNFKSVCSIIWSSLLDELTNWILAVICPMVGWIIIMDPLDINKSSYMELITCIQR
jgi:hypothetical protein